MKKPVVIEGSALPPNPQTAADAPPPPEPEAPEAAMARATRAAARPPSLFGRLVLWSALGLLVLVIGVTGWDFVTGLLTRNVLLGWLALGLGGVLALGALVVGLREAAALLRLGRIDTIQRHAAAAGEPGAGRKPAEDVAHRVLALYAGRRDLALGRDALRGRMPEILDPDALLAETERVMAPLDAEARAVVEGAARQVATATALVPLALADVVVALVVNIRMIRRIAEIYGGRGGTLGSWRLLRAVARHLVATGAVAVGDDLIGSVLGGGALSKISRRFGEGVVNGALTARVGIAAIEVCRPMPFAALPRPRTSRVVQRALSGLFQGG